MAHTSTSLLLIPENNPTMHAWVGLCNVLWKGICSVPDAMRKWPDSQESNETGINLAFGTDRTFLPSTFSLSAFFMFFSSLLDGIYTRGFFTRFWNEGICIAYS